MEKKRNATKHFTASALIVEQKKVLLVYHKKLGVWLYPGGHVEFNETPDEAVVREVREETGLDVEILGGVDDTLADAASDVSVLHLPYVILCELVGDHYHNDLVYICRIMNFDGRISHNQEESDGIDFFGIEDIAKIKLFPNFRRLLEKVLRECE